MSESPAPSITVKKKKRSFLDEDNFFIKKRPRVKSPASSQTNSPSSNEPSATHAHLNNASSPLKQEISPQVKPEQTPKNGLKYSLQETPLSYHSANESFQDSDAPTSPLFSKQNSGASLENGDPTSGSNTPVKAEETEPLSLGSPPSEYEAKEPDMSENGIKIAHSFPGSRESGHETADTEAAGPADAAQAEVIDDDFLDPDLKEFFSELAEKAPESSGEHSRIYSVKVTSRIGLPLEYEKEITGETSFAQLLEILSGETLREYNDADYWKHGVLVWIEGRSELKPFFKPKTLRLPQPPGYVPTAISCLYIPPEHVTRFESLYAEFDDALDLDNTAQNAESDDEILVVREPAPAEAAETKESGASVAGVTDKSQFFVIGLKGKDNKRIEAEVGPKTQIRSILQYYMEAKGIKETPGREGRILFEDEQLDLDAVVADTELEEDFEVQVYI